MKGKINIESKDISYSIYNNVGVIDETDRVFYYDDLETYIECNIFSTCEIKEHCIHKMHLEIDNIKVYNAVGTAIKISQAKEREIESEIYDIVYNLINKL